MDSVIVLPGPLLLRFVYTKRLSMNVNFLKNEFSSGLKSCPL